MLIKKSSDMHKKTQKKQYNISHGTWHTRKCWSTHCHPHILNGQWSPVFRPDRTCKRDSRTLPTTTSQCMKQSGRLLVLLTNLNSKIITLEVISTDLVIILRMSVATFDLGDRINLSWLYTTAYMWSILKDTYAVKVRKIEIQHFHIEQTNHVLLCLAGPQYAKHYHKSSLLKCIRRLITFNISVGQYVRDTIQYFRVFIVLNILLKMGHIFYVIFFSKNAEVKRGMFLMGQYFSWHFRVKNVGANMTV